MTITLDGTLGITTPSETNTGTLSVTGVTTLTGGLNAALPVLSGGTGVTTSTGTGAGVHSATPVFTTTIGVGAATASASGSGITFPATQSPSSDANTLDDYEEGTWTPTINFSGSSGNLTYATRVGTYTKIGRNVTFIAQLIFGETTAVGYLDTISGLPFTSAFRSGGGVYIDNFSSLSGGGQWTLTNDTSSSFVVYVSGTGSASAILVSSIPASSCTITVSGTYFV